MAKKQTNQDKIIAALDSVDKSVRNLRKFGDRYNYYINQAALKNDQKRVEQLINQKLAVYALINQLETLKTNIELGAYTSEAVASLGKLPAAIAGCKGLLSQSPNFKSLGKDIEKIFKDMKKPAEELSKLNDILNDISAPLGEDTLSSRLDGPINEKSEEFQAEYAEMMERIKAQTGKETVTKPATENAEMTGLIDYAGVIAEENNKK